MRLFAAVVLAFLTLSACKSSGPAEPPPSFTVTVTISGDGDGSVASAPAGIACGGDCDGSYEEGTSVTLTASPEVSSTFTGWSGAGCSGTGTCVVTVEAATTVTATFALNRYVLTVDSDGAGTGTIYSDTGSIACGAACTEELAHGATVTLTAFPDDGSAFVGWDGAGCSGTGTCAVTLTAAATVTATFGAFTAAWPDSRTTFCMDTAGAFVACPAGPEGQDGHYQIRVPTYTVAGGRVHDSVTGLTWERLPPFTLLAKADAITYCGSLELDGFDDWRVPSRLELASLSDAGRRGPPFYEAVFPDIPGNSFFWSRNADPANPGQSWVMNTNWVVSGFRDNTEVENSPGDGNIVRCVRGLALQNDLSAVGNTVVDAGTGLTWQSGTAPALMTWTEALAYCESLVLDAQDDWRLPSIKEWFSIVDDTLVAEPRIPILFAERPTVGLETLFWSSSPPPQEDNFRAYVLDTGEGISYLIGNPAENERNVRCVR